MLYCSRGPKGGRRGIVAVLVALSLVVLVGFVAIVIDGGLAQDRRRHAQAAADAAALAAAAELFLQDPTSFGLDTKQDAYRSARAIAAANGYLDDASGLTAPNTSRVTVRVPPVSGPFAGQRNHAEVIIEYYQPRYFSTVFGSGELKITARAVSRGAWAPVDDGILVLDLDDREALKINGGGANDVDAIMGGADVIVNSSDPAGTTVVGNADLTSMTGYNLTGGFSLSGGGTMTGPVTTDVPPTPDPLRLLPPPDPSTLPVQNGQWNFAGQKNVVLEPGVYPNGIKIAGQSQITMLSGIYYVYGGFEVAGKGGVDEEFTGSVTTDVDGDGFHDLNEGVLIYSDPGTNTSNDIKIGGNGSVTIWPMRTGPYAGISIWQERNSNVTVSITGNANMNITGTTYAANAPVDINGNGAVTIGSQYISRTLTIGGNGAVNIAYNPTIPPRRRVYMLVE